MNTGTTNINHVHPSLSAPYHFYRSEDEGFFIHQIRSGQDIFTGHKNSMMTDYYSIFITLDAKCRVQAGSEIYQVLPGDVLLINPHAHLYWNWTSVRNAYIITFKPSFFTIYSHMSLNNFALLSKSNAILINLTVAQIKEIEINCQQCLVNSLLPVSPYRYEILGNLLFALILKLFNAVTLRKPLFEDFTHDKNIGLVNNFLALLDKNFTDVANETSSTILGQRQYAEKLNVPPAYLYRFIRLNTGITVNGWIRRKLIEEIKYLLTNSEKTIKAVAAMYGFYEISNFYSFFKKHTGVSLSTFRKSGKKLTAEVHV